MNTKQYLKENQPIVYKTIRNAFVNNKAAHAYIIEGPKGSPVLDTAIFFAQSFVCLNKDEDGFACETCPHCERIKTKNYGDFLMFSGDEMRKADILTLQDNFNRTAVESSNTKIYIIHLIEKVKVQILNALLKFIEEPTSNIVAIFTSNQTSAILPTILSRCQIITLRELNFEASFNHLINNNVDTTDAWLISKISNNPGKNQEIASDENYIRAKLMLIPTLSYLKDVSEHLLVYFELECADITDNKESNKERNKAIIDYYLDMLACCLFESIRRQNDENYEPAVYKEYLIPIAEKYKNLDKSLQEISLSHINMLAINANKNLAFAKLFINLLKEAQ